MVYVDLEMVAWVGGIYAKKEHFIFLIDEILQCMQQYDWTLKGL